MTDLSFRFQSPTAMALVNSTFISDTEFSAVVYDMNSGHFVANMTIYGFKNGYKPSTYFKLIGEDLSCGDVECQEPIKFDFT